MSETCVEGCGVATGSPVIRPATSYRLPADFPKSARESQIMPKILLAFCAAFALAAAAGAAYAKPKPVGTVARANAAARRVIVNRFFQLDVRIAGPSASLHPGCRRLTVRTFRCDWSGENPAYYVASGVVRVVFRPYGVDATLARGWVCAPEGRVYDQTGVNECP